MTRSRRSRLVTALRRHRVTRLTVVPTADQRAGIIPGVRDPLTGQPFPGGVIPASTASMSGSIRPSST